MGDSHTNNLFSKNMVSIFLLVGLGLFPLISGAVTNEKDKTMTIIGVVGPIALHERVRVEVENLEDWMGQKDHDVSKFVFYEDGDPLKGVAPTLSLRPCGETNGVFFETKRNSRP